MIDHDTPQSGFQECQEIPLGQEYLWVCSSLSASTMGESGIATDSGSTSTVCGVDLLRLKCQVPADLPPSTRCCVSEMGEIFAVFDLFAWRFVLFVMSRWRRQEK